MSHCGAFLPAQLRLGFPACSLKLGDGIENLIIRLFTKSNHTCMLEADAFCSTAIRQDHISQVATSSRPSGRKALVVHYLSYVNLTRTQKACEVDVPNSIEYRQIYV